MTQVAILNIGDELLIGQVVNTNAAEMAKLDSQPCTFEAAVTVTFP